ncbi:MAG: hypothetical protein DRP58_03860 [Spirochaetes bacterium]|nr:MAG: hypothetical protein DRP58_03860 [Spirochaetota bacterium]
MSNNNSPERVSEKKVRAIALQVVVITILAIVFRQPVIMLILSIDFMFRAIISSKYSPLAVISKVFLAERLPFRSKIILMRPKKFAAAIGMILSAAAGIFGLAGYIMPMIYFTSILLFFSFLEAFFKFCAGCLMFGILIQLKIVNEDICLDCKLDIGK